MKRRGLPLLGLSLALLALGALPVAEDDKDDAIKKERKRFEGTWQVVSLEVDGNKSDEEGAKKFKVVNELDGKWTIEVEGGDTVRGTSTIDPTKKPKEVDHTVTEGNGAGNKLLGIYEFEGETRKVCLAPAEKGRPSEFAAPAESGRVLAVLKRVAK